MARGLIDVELPVVQAPMAGVQDAKLAVAVSNVGGLGSLPCAMLSPDALARELEYLAAHTSNPCGVNFFCHDEPHVDPALEAAWRSLLGPYYGELGIRDDDVVATPARRPFDHAAADIVERFKPAVVSFHFGLPAPALVQRVKETGARVLSTATTVDEARWLEAHGADGIIAQGFEAGGHRGSFLSDDLNLQISTFALVPQIVRAVSVPVIATGGIADAAGARAALALGAVGVQVGTAYLLADEATTRPVHRAALVDVTSCTAVTNLFTGRPARGIMNRLMRDLGTIRPDIPPFPLASTALAPLRSAAEARGCGDFSPLWAGQNRSGCRQASAADITRALAG
jgi:nitronate monooxygenase